MEAAAARACDYLETLAERRVAPAPEAIGQLSRLGGPLPQDPSDPMAVLALLDEVGSPATVASAGGRYFGFVIGGSLPAPLAANWLAGAWDQDAVFVSLSPVAASLENIALGWLLELLGLPQEAGGGFVTGATMANFAGLAAARHALLEKAGWDVESRGLFGAPEIRVVVGDEVHVSLLKALGLLGTRSRSNNQGSRGRAGTHAGRRPPQAGRHDDPLHPGRKREHGRLRPRA